MVTRVLIVSRFNPLVHRSEPRSQHPSPERPKPTNVVNLMDALRQSVEASCTVTSTKAKARAASPRSSSEKAEHPKRKKTRRTG
jgi:non-homologous end joining protein Ku